MNTIPKYGKFFGVLLILPLIVMVVYVAFMANDEIDIEDVAAIKISDERYIHRYTGRDDIEEYVSLILDAEEGAVQEVDSEATPYKIEFEIKDGGVKTYYFYPSLSEKSLIVDGMGLVRYAADTSSILARTEYESIYNERWLPSIKVSSLEGNADVLPFRYSWNFKKTNSEFYSYTEKETAKEKATVTVTDSSLKNGFVSFSVQPETMVISYSVDGKTYNSAEILPVSNGDVFSVTVLARWAQNDGSNFYGEGEWSFDCVYKASPVFYIDKTEVNAGETFVIYTENVFIGDSLTIKTDIITNKTSVVYKGENKNFALIPVDVETPAGKYDISISLDGQEQTLSVAVKATEGEFCTKTVNAEVYNAVFSPDGKAEYENFLSSLTPKSSACFLWDDETLRKPVENEVKTGFAWNVLYNGVPPQIFHKGISFDTPEKTSVLSSAKGKVAFSGETAKTGKVVVIDHGCGIMTHYCHLSVVSAFEGEEVEAGKLIGLSGSTGYTDGADVYFAVSINGIFVNPEMFFGP